MSPLEVASNNKSYERLTLEQAITELKKRDEKIVELLKEFAIAGISKQFVKNFNLCSKKETRYSWNTLCDEATFRYFVGIKGAEKTKARKMSVEEFNEFTNSSVQNIIRDGTKMGVKGEYVNICLLKGEQMKIRITGWYGPIYRNEYELGMRYRADPTVR